MIKKILKLKNFGIFSDFIWPDENKLSEFKKFNLVYGWNRSGKTTISRVFSSCERKSNYDTDKFKQYPENGEFELKVDNYTLKNTDVAVNTIPVKVFNQDFIEENLSFDPLNSCNPIIYISEEDIEIKNKLKILNDQKQLLLDKYQEAKILHESAKKIEDGFRISLAQTITGVLTDKTKKDRYYSYDKSKVKEKINEIGIDNFKNKILSDKDKKNCETIKKSEETIFQSNISTFTFSFSFSNKTINSFQKIYEEVKNLLNKKVISEILDRLKNDQDLNNWVKQGFDLYKTKNKKEKCLFCQKSLDSDFLDTLSKHFSKDYEELQNSITILKNEITRIKKQEIPTNNDYIYPDLKEIYSDKAKELNECIQKMGGLD